MLHDMTDVGHPRRCHVTRAHCLRQNWWSGLVIAVPWSPLAHSSHLYMYISQTLLSKATYKVHTRIHSGVKQLAHREQSGWGVSLRVTPRRPARRSRGSNQQPSAYKSARSTSDCYTCVFTGFDCRCGHVFCGTHRYSDLHGCTFDYRADAAAKIKKENPVVVAEKVKKIWTTHTGGGGAYDFFGGWSTKSLSYFPPLFFFLQPYRLTLWALKHTYHSKSCLGSYFDLPCICDWGFACVQILEFKNAWKSLETNVLVVKEKRGVSRTTQSWKMFLKGCMETHRESFWNNLYSVNTWLITKCTVKIHNQFCFTGFIRKLHRARYCCLIN